jgi:hypothetical protein
MFGWHRRGHRFPLSLWFSPVHWNVSVYVVLGDHDRLIMDRFLAVLDASGLDHSRGQNR